MLDCRHVMRTRIISKMYQLFTAILEHDSVPACMLGISLVYNIDWQGEFKRLCERLKTTFMLRVWWLSRGSCDPACPRARTRAPQHAPMRSRTDFRRLFCPERSFGVICWINYCYDESNSFKMRSIYRYNLNNADWLLTISIWVLNLGKKVLKQHETSPFLMLMI